MSKVERYHLLEAVGSQVLPVLLALPDVEVEAGTRPTFTDEQIATAVEQTMGETGVGSHPAKVAVAARLTLVRTALAQLPVRQDPDALVVPDHAVTVARSHRISVPPWSAQISATNHGTRVQSLPGDPENGAQVGCVPSRAMNSLMRTRTALGLVAAASLLVLSACGGSSDDASRADKDASASESAQRERRPRRRLTGGPDVSGIPDVVAEVNGEEVTKDEFVPLYQAAFQQAAAQAQTSGQAPDEEQIKKQTADDLVSTELLAQEAESRGIEVSDDDVDAELEDIAKQNQLGSADELLEAIEKNGMTEDQARDQVETQLLVEGLVEDEDGSTTPTEKELRAIYAEAKQQAAGQQGQKIPPYAQVRDQIAEQARTEQVGKVAQALLEDLRKDADITINL